MEGKKWTLKIGTTEISVPSKFGKYEIIKYLGTGKYSVVFLVKNVENPSLGPYACKICSHQILAKNGILGRFERELQILKSINSEYVVKLYDLIFDASYIYLILEYCQNGELFDYIVSKGKIEEKEAKTLFYNILKGVDFIHKQNIAHRDLKPENILLDANNNPKLFDFALCHQIYEDNLLKTPCGSAFYAPPEIILQKEYDGKKSDIWALGVILYTMVTGSLPWKETNTKALFQQIIDADYIVPKTVSPQIASLIEKMMNINPSERPTTEEILTHSWFDHIERPILLTEKCMNKSKRAIIVKPSNLNLASTFAKKQSSTSPNFFVIRKRTKKSHAHNQSVKQ